MTGIYALVHMAVDLSCAFLVFAYVVGGEGWYLWLLVYNVCAFAMQMPIGAAADRLNRNGMVAAGGCVGVLAGLGLGAAGYPAAASLTAGVGNACFHVGGGIDVLNHCEKKAGPLGLFVAPGALGVYIGTVAGKTGTGMAIWVAGLLLLSAVLIPVAADSRGLWRSSGNLPVRFENRARSRRILLAVGCCLCAVILRSFSGMVQKFPWKETFPGGALLLILCVVLGKILGGILGDRMGITRTAFLSMGAAALGFLCLEHPFGGLGAVLFWNMSMPLTLWAVAGAFPGAKGFGFGLLTFGLFLGFCPVYLEGAGSGTRNLLSSAGLFTAASAPAGMALMAVLSLFLLGWGLRQVVN